MIQNRNCYESQISVSHNVKSIPENQFAFFSQDSLLALFSDGCCTGLGGDWEFKKPNKSI